MNQALFFSFSKDDIKLFVVELNTGFNTNFGQLWQGIDSEGRKLSDIGGDYAPITEEIKRFKGLPFDRVTLFDEGDFYRSFTVKPGKDSIVIQADSVSKYDEDLTKRWGKDIIGLTDDSISRLNKELITYVIQHIIQQLLR